MVFPSHDVRTGGMNGQELFLSLGPEAMTLVLSANFIGADDDTAFLLPLQAVPDEVRDADDALFVALETGTVPVVSVEQDYDEPVSIGCAKSGDAGNLSRGESNVELLDRGMTATYEYVVVGGDTGSTLAEWLNDNGFGVPADFEGALDDYASAGWVFLAARLSATGTGRVAPLELQLPASGSTTEIPFGIGSYSLPPGEDIDITLYVVSEGPVLPQNYAVETIDPGQLEAIDEGTSNYGEVFDGIVDAAPTWVVEYSYDWNPDALDFWVKGDEEYGIYVEEEVDEAWLTDFHTRLDLQEGRLTRLRTRLGADELSDAQLDIAQLDYVDRNFYVTWDPDGGEGCGVGPSPERGALWFGLAAIGLVRLRRRRS